MGCWIGTVNYPKCLLLPTIPKRWQGCVPLCLDIFNMMNGSNWFDSTGQGKGKITLQKIIIQFLCKRNKSPLLATPLLQFPIGVCVKGTAFMMDLGPFMMTTQGINTAQHRRAWELLFQGKCNKRREPSYTRDMKAALADYGKSTMFSLRRISYPPLAQSSWGIRLLFQLLWTLLLPPENVHLSHTEVTSEHKGKNHPEDPFTASVSSLMGKDFKRK